MPIEYQSPPLVTDAYCSDTISCVRPLRMGGPRLDIEQYLDKTIIHNYGHGGMGVSLLFGFVNAAQAYFDQHRKISEYSKDQSIAVVGAGCIGLLTAINLAQKGYRVDVIAKDLDNLTSHTAGGFFSVPPRGQTGIGLYDINQLSRESFSWYQGIMNGMHSFISANVVHNMPLYADVQTLVGADGLVRLGLVEPPTQIMLDFGNNKRHLVRKFFSMHIDTDVLMKDLTKEAARLGIHIIRKEITSFDELNHEVVFNCAGLGAKGLANDSKIVPSLGHMLSLYKQNSRQYMVWTHVMQQGKKSLLYYAPKRSGFVGGTVIKGRQALQNNDHQFALLQQRAIDFFGD